MLECDDRNVSRCSLLSRSLISLIFLNLNCNLNYAKLGRNLAREISKMGKPNIKQVLLVSLSNQPSRSILIFFMTSPKHLSYF
jgi:hypothetical protein